MILYARFSASDEPNRRRETGGGQSRRAQCVVDGMGEYPNGDRCQTMGYHHMETATPSRHYCNTVSHDPPIIFSPLGKTVLPQPPVSRSIAERFKTLQSKGFASGNCQLMCLPFAPALGSIAEAVGAFGLLEERGGRYVSAISRPLPCGSSASNSLRKPP